MESVVSFCGTINSVANILRARLDARGKVFMTDPRDEFKTDEIVSYSVFPYFRNKFGIIQADGMVRLLNEELVEEFNRTNVSITIPIDEVDEIEHVTIGDL